MFGGVLRVELILMMIATRRKVGTSRRDKYLLVVGCAPDLLLL